MTENVEEVNSIDSNPFAEDLDDEEPSRMYHKIL